MKRILVSTLAILLGLAVTGAGAAATKAAFSDTSQAVVTVVAEGGRNMITLGAGATSCAIDEQGAAWCWGSNSGNNGTLTGSIGDGTNIDRPYPVRVDTSGALKGKKLTKIVVAGNHTCTIDTEGKAYCWGANSYGGVGNGTTTPVLSPFLVNTGTLAGRTVIDIDVRGHTTCAIDSTSAVHCWGQNDFGRLGNGTSGVNSSVPVLVTSTGVLKGVTLKKITVGAAVVVLSDTGRLYAWGRGDTGSLGNGTLASSSVPVAVNTGAGSSLNGKTIASIETAGFVVCALDTGGLGHCWGKAVAGNAGTGAAAGTTLSTPTLIDTTGALKGKTLTYIGMNPGTTCATDTDGKAYCWGEGPQGDLGNGTITAAQLTPVAVDDTGVLAGHKLVEVSGSGGPPSMFCGLDDTGLAFCWGAVGYGGLGDGQPDGSAVPVRVQRPW